MRPRVDICTSTADLESAAEREVLLIARQAIHDRGVCTLALSGGETPRGLYRRLGALPPGEAPGWSRIHLCFGDERMVPPGSPESNYGMVRHEIICRVPLPAGNVHRIRGERPPDIAAGEYAADLGRTLPLSGGRFDLVLLGLGDDGHTASLFPGTDVLGERERTARAVFVPRLSAWRVTVTFPVINSARNVLFLVAGSQKQDIVRRVLASPGPDAEIPATLVDPADSPAHWLLDSEAGASVQPGTGIDGGGIR
jgi:6-phosphogluconolactonase